MFAAAVPVFVSVTLWVAVVPTGVFPKARVFALGLRTAAFGSA